MDGEGWERLLVDTGALLDNYERALGRRNTNADFDRELRKLDGMVSKLEKGLAQDLPRRMSPDRLRNCRARLDKVRRRAHKLTGGAGAKLGHDEVDKKGILQKQNQIMKEQDMALDDISTQLGRVNQISRGINNEVNLQTSLLDDLEAGVDQGNEGVGAASREAQNVIETGGTCKLWVAIIALAILLIILLSV
mmetsp:Transcript_19096/g.31285  ORF Transcript_19096/g.31285 Transcript_19096/m.31285 type:complete len:193 (-) Transcript_19096:818-1396(-)